MTDRELDALVAERVMGWKTFAGEPGYGRPPGKVSLVLDEIPHYSTDRERAMDVFSKMNDHPDFAVWERFYVAVGGKAPADPKAICLAALAALPKEGG